MADKKEVTSGINLAQEDKQLLKDVENTANLTREDVEDLDRKADYTHMTLEQIGKELHKLRKEHTEFKLEMRKIVNREIEKEIRPLAEKLELLTTNKPRFIYIRSRFDISRMMSGIIKKTWHQIVKH